LIQQKIPTSIGGEIKAPADVIDIEAELFEQARKKSGRNYAEA